MFKMRATMNTQIEFAERVIRNLGGATKVARLLHAASNGTEPWTPQRVQNWLKRGIPPKVQLDYPTIISAGAAEEQSSHA